MISTRDLVFLPDIVQLKRLTQSLAILDAIIEPDWERRYYSFDAHWAREQSAAFMRDGSGDDTVILFEDNVGAILKGFAHECAMSPHRNTPPELWPGVMDDVPAEFSEFLSEPAFVPDDATFCLWRRNTDDAWQRGAINFPPGADPDGSAALLGILDGDPKTYHSWAQAYYEREIDLATIKRIYRHQPLCYEMVEALNQDWALDDVRKDAAEIAYPVRF